MSKSKALPQEGQLSTALEAYRDFARPNEFMAENVGEGMDAQLAISGYKSVQEARKMEQAQTERNIALINAVLSVLPHPNAEIDLDNPRTLAHARQLQSHILYSGRIISDSMNRYVIGSHARGRNTDLLLAGRLDRVGEHEYSGGVAPYLPTVPTKNFQSAIAAAKAREATPFTQKEIEQMRMPSGSLVLTGNLETSMKWTTRSLKLHDRLKEKIMTGEKLRPDGSVSLIPVLESIQLNRAGLYGEGINNSVIEKFDVVRHLAELATSLGCADEALKNIADLEQNRG